MRKRLNLSYFLPYFPAITSGFLLSAAFPDAGIFWTAFFALTPLWVSVRAMTPKRAFYAGLWAGLAHYLTLIYWIVPTLTVFGKLPAILSLSCLVLLALYLATYTGIFAFAVKKRPVPDGLMPLWGAALWTGLEFIRTHALTGFPWGVLGYSQYANPYLLQTADLFGVLGISFILVACNGVLALAWTAFRTDPGRIRRLGLPLVYGMLLVALAHLYGVLRLDTVDRWTAEAPKPRISVIQGNIEQDKKWDKAFKAFTLDQYRRLSLDALPADLVVAKESIEKLLVIREGEGVVRRERF